MARLLAPAEVWRPTWRRPGLAFARGRWRRRPGVRVCLRSRACLAGPRFGNLVLVAVPLPTAALARRCAGDLVPARVVAGADLAWRPGRRSSLTRPRTAGAARGLGPPLKPLLPCNATGRGSAGSGERTISGGRAAISAPLASAGPCRRPGGRHADPCRCRHDRVGPGAGTVPDALPSCLGRKAWLASPAPAGAGAAGANRGLDRLDPYDLVGLGRGSPTACPPGAAAQSVAALGSPSSSPGGRRARRLARRESGHQAASRAEPHAVGFAPDRRARAPSCSSCCWRTRRHAGGPARRPRRALRPLASVQPPTTCPTNDCTCPASSGCTGTAGWPGAVDDCGVDAGRYPGGCAAS